MGSASVCLSDHVWSLEEIVLTADSYMQKPGKRGPYKKRISKLKVCLNLLLHLASSGMY